MASARWRRVLWRNHRWFKHRPLWIANSTKATAFKKQLLSDSVGPDRSQRKTSEDFGEPNDSPTGIWIIMVNLGTPTYPPMGIKRI